VSVINVHFVYNRTISLVMSNTYEVFVGCLAYSVTEVSVLVEWRLTGAVGCHKTPHRPHWPKYSDMLHWISSKS